jgi:homoserine kinase type II
MAVYTDVAFEDLEAFLDTYAIGTPRSFKGIAEGVENSNFVLQTSEGTFILTLYEKRVKADELPFFLHLLDHLASRGVPCPVPVKNCAGRQSTVLNGRPAAILTWLDGLSLKRPEPRHCAAVGTALAQLHDAGADFPLVRANNLGLAGWRELAVQTLPHADTVREGLAELIQSSLTEIESAWPSSLPEGIIHADLFPDNVLFIGDQVSGLIDFYFACNDAYAYDLAIMLNAWCFEPDGAYNVTKGRSLVAGYRRRRPLGAAEIEALPVLAAGAALRFLLTRLHDWLWPDPTALVRAKDPREYAKRLLFHRKVRSTAEYGL